VATKAGDFAWFPAFLIFTLLTPRCRLVRFNHFRSRRGNEAELTPEGPPTHVGGYSFPGTALEARARTSPGHGYEMRSTFEIIHRVTRELPTAVAKNFSQDSSQVDELFDAIGRFTNRGNRVNRLVPKQPVRALPQKSVP